MPYHSYRQSDHDPAPLADGYLSLDFDLMPVSWVFKAGHRIRLSLAGADNGTFQSRLGPGDNVIWRVRTGRGASELVLPWVRER